MFITEDIFGGDKIAHMEWSILLFVFVSLVIVWITRWFRAAETPYKRPIAPPPLRSPQRPEMGPQPRVMTNPYVIFNEVSTSKTFVVGAGRVIRGRSYIVSGEVGVYLERRRTRKTVDVADEFESQNEYESQDISEQVDDNLILIGILRDGAMTHSCFDLIGISTNVVRRTHTETTFSPLPPGDGYVNLVMFEKTCIEPLVRYFHLQSLTLSFERVCCVNFSRFVSKHLSIEVRPSHSIFKSNLQLDECLVWVESGSLAVNGMAFGQERIIGILGLLFSSCRQGLRYSSPTGAVIQYISYRDIVGVQSSIQEIFLESMKTDKGRANTSPNMGPNEDTSFILRNDQIDNYIVVLGATSQWLRLGPNHELVRKGMRCEEVFLLDDREIGNMECIREMCYPESFITDKVTDAIRIPRSTIEARIVVDASFYRLCTRRMFHSEILGAKALLITPCDGGCAHFVQRLDRVLGADSIVVKESEIFAVLHGHFSDQLGYLLLTEYLGTLKTRYKVVIVHIENEWSRVLCLFSYVADLIYVVGTAPTPNYFSKRNVEFVQLYERRVHTERMISRLRRVFFKRGESSTSSTEEEDLRPDQISAPSTAYAGSPNITSVVKKVVRSTFAPKPAFRRTISTISCNPFNSGDSKTNPCYKRNHHILCPREDNHCMKDFERLKRYLLGEKVGLVLGGGGARGFAHIGVIQALEEENIPIDCVGGTSMGAFVGALYSQQLDFLQVYSHSKKLAKSLSSRLNCLWDITYPYVSLFSGRSFEKALASIFKRTHIQNLWLEFYCVVTNLARQEEKAIFNGPVAKWVRASMTICGVLPPLIVRGEYYVDGAYSNNVPADVMKSLDVRTVIAVDVSQWSTAEADPYDSKSGFILLFKRFFTSKRYLSIFDLQYRLAFLSTESKLRALDSEALLIRPNLGAYATSDFLKFDEIVACGYEAAKAAIREWKRAGLINKTPRHKRRFSI
eukprot:Pompholyxophrys_punicea_v1_NODE_1_length_14747_cov_12.267901.p2 type:complete len:965 gc:universal NODE_1_length_14747_cov_12.267901:14472-11578(-)